MTEAMERTESVESMITQAMKASAGTVVVVGIATLIAGLLAIAAPFVAGTAVNSVIAILMVAAGIARTIFAFSAESWGKGILAFFLGIITTFCGLDQENQCEYLEKPFARRTRVRFFD